MSFHHWLYFIDAWELDALLNPPVSVAAETVVPVRGGGSGRMREYERLSSDYWDARQQALVREPAMPVWENLLVPKPPQRTIVMPDTSPPRRPPPPPPPPTLSPEQRGAYLSSMKDATSLDDLKKLSRTLSRYA